MQYDAMKLYNSINFLDAVEVLWTIRSKTRFTLFEKISKQINRRNESIGKISKDLARVR